MKRVISYILILCIILSFAGCSESGMQAAVFEWDTPPYNIDPLLATEQGELTVVRNIFEPLMIAQEDGTLTYGAAKSHSVDSSGLIYTFLINTESKWSDGTPVTPNDFLFALKRAVDPKTKSTCAISLNCIKNATEIGEGKMSVDKLGVYASGNSLIIELVKQDKNILRTLSDVAGMPCNSFFFEKSGGKYGMTEDTIISNGPFYVSSWNTDQDMESLRISENEHYKGKNKPTLSRVRFSYEPSENRFSRLKNSEIDCGGMDISLLRTAESEGVITLKYGMGVSSLIYNSNSSVCKNADLRKALTLCADVSSAEGNLPKHISSVKTIIGKDYLAPDGFYKGTQYSSPSGDAKTLFQSAVKAIDTKDLSNLTLYYADDETSKLYASYIAQGWQKTLGLYITLTPLSNSEVKNRLESGDYSFMICPFVSSNNMASQVLSNFTSLSDYNKGCFVSDEFDRLVSLGDTNSLKTAESILYNECRVIPLFETYNAYCIGSKVKEYKLFPGSNILDFSKIE